MHMTSIRVLGNFLAFSAEQKKNVPRVDEGQVHSNEREIVFTTGSHFLLPLIRCVVKDWPQSEESFKRLQISVK